MHHPQLFAIQVPDAGGDSDGDFTDGSEFMAGADEPDSDVDFDSDVLEEMEDDAAPRAQPAAARRRARVRAEQAPAPAVADDAPPSERQHRYSTRHATPVQLRAVESTAVLTRTML